MQHFQLESSHRWLNSSSAPARSFGSIVNILRMKSRQVGDNVRAPPLCSSTKASKDVIGNASLCRRDPVQESKHDLDAIRKFGLTVFIEPRPAQSAAASEARGELAQGPALGRRGEIGDHTERGTEASRRAYHTTRRSELFLMAEEGDGTMQPALHMSTGLPQPACRATSGGRMPTDKPPG